MDSRVSDLLQSMSEYAETMQVVEETARGFREHMVRNGWDEHLAQHIAAAVFFSRLIQGSDE